MRVILLAISVLLSRGLAFQAASGITTDQTRLMTSVSEMGHTPPEPTRLNTMLSFEQGDDPTINAHPVPQHEPIPAARKAAEKAEHLARKKNHEEAIADYRKAVELDPQYFEAWNNLALELSASGNKTEAEQVFRRLVVSNPEHVVVFTNLASLLGDEKRYPEAEAIARQAMKQHDFSFSANYVLGSMLVNQGKWTDEAKTKLEYAQTKYAMAKTLLERWPRGQ